MQTKSQATNEEIKFLTHWQLQNDNYTRCQENEITLLLMFVSVLEIPDLENCHLIMTRQQDLDSGTHKTHSRQNSTDLFS